MMKSTISHSHRLGKSLEQSGLLLLNLSDCSKEAL